MRPIRQSSAIFVASGILLGNCAFLCAADEKKLIEKATLTISDQEITRLIHQLGSMGLMDREQATQELSKIGKFALPSLKQAAASPGPEVRTRAQQLIERMEPSRPIAARVDPLFCT
jgi:hypothetical protein